MNAMLKFNGQVSPWFALIMRIALGAFFFASGYGKYFTEAGSALMLETITEAGIFYPMFMSVFVAGCEVVFGLMLALGFFVRVSALVLTVISIVALFAVAIHQIPADISFLAWYSWLLYLPESAYILIGSFLVFAGGGRFSVDNVLSDLLER